MTGSPYDWPALRPPAQSAPPAIEALAYERGVWGKVHGQATDYRWIAQSEGFGRFAPALEGQLRVGVEDEPHQATFWRVLPEACFGVGIYPSQATDAAGRGGQLIEKQILAWPRPPGVTSALGALLLLPHVATLGDDVWWPSRADERWAESDFVLPLDGREHPPLAADEERLKEAIELGLEALKDRVSQTALAKLYAQLLDGREPAWLAGLDHPLPPAAVAALLLPLPRRLADRLSVAGWVPSSRVDPERLASCWQVLVEPAGHDFAPDDESPGDRSKVARFLAKAVLDGDSSLASVVLGNNDLSIAAEEVAVATPETPAAAVTERAAERPSPAAEPPPAAAWNPFGDRPMRPGVQLPLDAADAAAGWVLRTLDSFARDADRRWITPENLSKEGSCQPLPPDAPGARLLFSWIQALQARRPVYADAEQWAVKIDLLRAAALALVPAPSTLKAVGKLTSGRVPPLYFGSLLEPRMRDHFEAFGDDLQRLIDDSLGCTSDALRQEVRSCLKEWRHHSAHQEIRQLISRKL